MEIAQATRVSLEYLDALEAGRWNEIPRAYIRGYLGLYAQAVGMNKEKVLRSFDYLISPILNVEKATLDETPPLLTQPEHVEVTRVKIRAAWFAALSRNRKAIYLLTMLMVLGILASLYISRRIQQETINMISFAVSFKENSTRSHEPFTNLPLILDSSRAGITFTEGCWVRLIGTRFGSVAYERSVSHSGYLRFSAYDTINIEYLHDLTLKIHPIQSALCYSADSLIRADSILTGDIECYRLGSTKVEPMKTEVAVDSLK